MVPPEATDTEAVSVSIRKQQVNLNSYNHLNYTLSFCIDLTEAHVAHRTTGRADSRPSGGGHVDAVSDELIKLIKCEGSAQQILTQHRRGEDGRSCARCSGHSAVNYPCALAWHAAIALGWSPAKLG
jgi:hypothetical protein